MRNTRFTDEQMVAILCEADRTPVVEAAKKHKVSDQTIYAWRKHFGAKAPAGMKRLRTQEAEDNKLKTMLAERAPTLNVMNEINRRKR